MNESVQIKLEFGTSVFNYFTSIRNLLNNSYTLMLGPMLRFS
jgi:hypothetical protein